MIYDYIYSLCKLSIDLFHTLAFVTRTNGWLASGACSFALDLGELVANFIKTFFFIAFLVVFVGHRGRRPFHFTHLRAL